MFRRETSLFLTRSSAIIRDKISSSEATESRLRANDVNVKMMERFAKVCGSYICNDLLKCDISTPEGVAYAREQKLFTEFCPTMVANAVDILEEIISEVENG